MDISLKIYLLTVKTYYSIQCAIFFRLEEWLPVGLGSLASSLEGRRDACRCSLLHCP